MSKFQIYRADLNKVVCKEVEADTADGAISKYASALMAYGMLPMRDSAIEFLSNVEATLHTVKGSRFNVMAQAL